MSGKLCHSSHMTNHIKIHFTVQKDWEWNQRLKNAMNHEFSAQISCQGILTLTLNITLFSSSVSDELSLLSDGGLLLDLPEFWLDPLLLFEVPLCAELGRIVSRLGCTPIIAMNINTFWNTEESTVNLYINNQLNTVCWRKSATQVHMQFLQH